MLTDIFANRYTTVLLWKSFEEKDRRFLVQAFRIVGEQLYPYWTSDGKENKRTKEKWLSIHDKLSMELGLEELSNKTFLYGSTWKGKTSTQVGFKTMDVVCKDFVCATPDGSVSADQFMKERISFIEIAFRQRADDVEVANTKLLKDFRSPCTHRHPSPPGIIRLPGDRIQGLKALNDRVNREFLNAVDELNTRIRQAGYDLNYHNGFIQRFTDPRVEEQIERAFWPLVADGTWKNVDVDMKEAIDSRDGGGRDPALYAARALESTIKIISDKKGWSKGSEKGAHNYIDNLGSKRAGQFIDVWEKGILKDFFTHVRNPLSHGPGSEEMPILDPQQTDWAIEFGMSWIKSLIRRMQ